VKVFFDTNVYVAESLLGEMAEQIIEATERASWRIYASTYLLDELERVLVMKLRFSRRLASLSRGRILRRAKIVDPGASRHEIPRDPADGPILRAALAAEVDYLVTNDAHLLELDPYEGVRIISMSAYSQLLDEEGLLGEQE
jgi:putative PIN family toxin of toxin-antitoxin system